MRIDSWLAHWQPRLPTDSARLDAELLLAEVLQKPRLYLRSHGEQPLSTEQQLRLSELAQRRQAGEPMAYILGRQEFWSLDLQVSSSVLIPRADTETLVEQALALIPAAARWTLADLGTGSGAIALALATERPDCRILASDRSPDALAIAQANAERLRLKVEFFCGDWLQALPAEPLDLIVSNPPYIADTDPHLAALSHEPRSALVAAEQGLKDLSEIAQQARALLKPGGWLLLEHGYDQGEAVRNLLQHCGYQHVRTQQDLAGNDRISLAHWSPA